MKILERDNGSKYIRPELDDSIVNIPSIRELSLEHAIINMLEDIGDMDFFIRSMKQDDLADKYSKHMYILSSLVGKEIKDGKSYFEIEKYVKESAKAALSQR